MFSGVSRTLEEMPFMAAQEVIDLETVCDETIEKLNEIKQKINGIKAEAMQAPSLRGDMQEAAEGSETDANQAVTEAVTTTTVKEGSEESRPFCVGKTYTSKQGFGCAEGL